MDRFRIVRFQQRACGGRGAGDHLDKIALVVWKQAVELEGGLCAVTGARADLLDAAVAHDTILSAMVIASIWSWVT